MRTLIVAPMSREARAIPGNVFVCGSGEGAPRRVDAAVEAAHAEAVIIAGVCGGLDPSLAPGGLILGRRLIAGGEPELETDARLLRTAQRALRERNVPFVSSTLLTVDRPIASTAERTRAWNEYGAAGVDMETYGIARALAARGVRWLVLRAVVDPAGGNLPSALLQWRAEEDEREIVRRTLRTPAAWPGLVRLALQMRSATRSLARSVPIVADAAACLVAAEDTAPDSEPRQFVSVS